MRKGGPFRARGPGVGCVPHPPHAPTPRAPAPPCPASSRPAPLIDSSTDPPAGPHEEGPLGWAGGPDRQQRHVSAAACPCSCCPLLPPLAAAASRCRSACATATSLVPHLRTAIYRSRRLHSAHAHAGPPNCPRSPCTQVCGAGQPRQHVQHHSGQQGGRLVSAQVHVPGLALPAAPLQAHPGGARRPAGARPGLHAAQGRAPAPCCPCSWFRAAACATASRPPLLLLRPALLIPRGRS